MADYKSLESNQLGIADGMIDWVRVVDKNNIVLYVNKKMQEDLKENLVGKNATMFYAGMTDATFVYRALPWKAAPSCGNSRSLEIELL